MRSQVPVLLVSPSLLFALVFFIIPLVMLIGSSFTIVEAGVTRGTLQHYREIVTDGYYWEVMLRTMRVSFFATLFALIVSYPSALYLYFSASKWRRVFLFVIVSPLFVSVIVRTYGWIILLSPNGPIHALMPEGFRPRLLHTEGAMIVGLMHIYVPFMVLALNAALFKVDKRLLSAAASLGASNLRIFRDILLPPSLPGMVSGCVIVFSISMTAFSTPVLLGGSANKTMPYLIYQQNLLLADWNFGGALAVVLLIVTFAFVRGISLIVERGKMKAALQ